MTKTIALWTICFGVICTLCGFFFGITVAKREYDPPIHVSYTDELPGIGNTKDNPAHCISYWDKTDKSVHIEYAK